MLFDRSATIVLIFLSLILCISCKSIENLSEEEEDSKEVNIFDDKADPESIIKKTNSDLDKLILLKNILTSQSQEEQSDDLSNDSNNDILNDNQNDSNNDDDEDDLENRPKKRDTTYEKSRIIKSLYQPNKKRYIY